MTTMEWVFMVAGVVMIIAVAIFVICAAFVFGLICYENIKHKYFDKNEEE